MFAKGSYRDSPLDDLMGATRQFPLPHAEWFRSCSPMPATLWRGRLPGLSVQGALRYANAHSPERMQNLSTLQVPINGVSGTPKR